MTLGGCHWHSSPHCTVSNGLLLWSSGQSSWLQIQRSRVRFSVLPDFWKVVGLERGPLSLVSTTEELLERKSSGSSLESREYGCRDSSRWPRDNLYPQRVGTNFAPSGGRSLGIVCSRAMATVCLKVCSDRFTWAGHKHKHKYKHKHKSYLLLQSNTFCRPPFATIFVV
jgi:hypothetical protein